MIHNQRWVLLCSKNGSVIFLLSDIAKLSQSPKKTPPKKKVLKSANLGKCFKNCAWVITEWTTLGLIFKLALNLENFRWKEPKQ